MKGARVLAALAAALPVFYFSPWVALTTVHQPAQVEAGAAFEALVHGVARLNGGPWLVEPDTAAAGADDPAASMPPIDEPPYLEGSVDLRLGVLAPAGWKIESVAYSVTDFLPPPPLPGAPFGPERDGALVLTPDETWVYEAYHPAPAGFEWLAFGGVEVDVTWQSQILFAVHTQTGPAEGRYHLVYGTWSQPPYWYLDGGTAPPSDSLIPVPPPSFVGADIVVGDVGPAPRVTAISPPDGAADVPVGDDIRVTFDRDMDLGSLRDGGIRVYSGPVYYPAGRTPGMEEGPAWRTDSPLDPLFVPPPWEPWPVPVQIFWNAATKTAVVDPLEPLHGHTVYTTLVTHGARASDGAPVAEQRSASFLTESRPPAPFFSDVPPAHRFRRAIETLFGAGIVAGFHDGTFRPDDPVTRGQLAAMLVRLLGLHTLEPDPPPPFYDLPSPAQDAGADYVAEAARAGIVAGFDDGTFRAGDPVTRIQMTRMIVRATQPYLAAPPPDYTAGFVDVDPVDRGFADWAAFNDLADGKAPGRFDPWGTATRGHASRLLFGAWNLIPRPMPG